jgi:hypothetical protein
VDELGQDGLVRSPLSLLALGLEARPDLVAQALDLGFESAWRSPVAVGSARRASSWALAVAPSSSWAERSSSSASAARAASASAPAAIPSKAATMRAAPQEVPESPAKQCPWSLVASPGRPPPGRGARSAA